ncbi:MAG: hypothetical protein EOO52_07700 [Gammaproteobacteria bacterium]|nr:MAG: hypothetical protein EOO52_07700 [Gammaproteobacteria bacterium]
MSDIHKSLRLGDLLVEKGLITAPQLRHAIDLQKARYDSPKISSINTKHELGEILIELGYISRHQLNTNLSWQRRLKATTAMMVFVAPLLTAACGGGGGSGGGGGGNSNNQPANTVSSQMAAENPPPSSSYSVSSAKSSSLAPKSSSVSAPKSSSANSSISSESVEGPVQLLWSVPTARENGEYLDISEIGGYEIRYKLDEDTNYKSIVIKDAYVDSYYFDYLKGDYHFEIATFDNTGLYSKFVPVGPSK